MTPVRFVSAFSLYLILIFSFNFTAHAQDLKQYAAGTEQPRPRIGLVLSGGGARGFAHIGVLRLLEENNIPVDYIAGTSMGSIIGGLYAIGMSADEIEAGVMGIDWLNVFKDNPDRQHKYFRRKQDVADFYSMHRVGINEDGLQITPGIIEGQQIEIALDRLAYPGFHIRDFDKLHIPYRAIATDIETGEPVIIKSGNLAKAMRASMSIPGALPPIKIGDKLVVDGGIANNVPIDIVRDMGADIVIVVDVSAPLDSKDKIKSTLDVTGQLTTILTRRIADVQIAAMKDDDVLIVPQAYEISSSDFIQYPALIAEGYRVALEQIDRLKTLSLSQQSYQRYQAALPEIAVATPVIDFIKIVNRTALRDEVFRARINQQIGKPLDVQQLEQDLAFIYGLDYSSSVVYDIARRDDQHGLVIYVRDREWAESDLEFGLTILSTFEVNSITNLGASYTNKRLNDLGGEFRAVLGVGSEPQLIGEYYQPINTSLKTIISLRAGVTTQVVPILIGGHIESIQRINNTITELTLGQAIGNNTLTSIGMGYVDGRFTSIAGLEAIDPAFIESYYLLRIDHDSMDNLSFPNNGVYGSLEIIKNSTDIGADVDFEQIQLDISAAVSFDRYSVFARASAQTTTDEENLPLNGYLINGGFMDISGTIYNELVSPHFGMLQTALYRRLGDIAFLPMYAGFSLEAGNAWDSKDNIDSDNLIYAGSLFIGADTFMGPLYFAYGHNDTGDNAIYLYIGRSFLQN